MSGDHNMYASKDTDGLGFPELPESAFPSTFKSLDETEQRHRYGMTLRDYFAAKAMAALMPTDYIDANARRAYVMADAMIQARGETK